MFDSGILFKTAYSWPSIALVAFIGICFWGWAFALDAILPKPQQPVQIAIASPTPTPSACTGAEEFYTYSQAHKGEMRRSPAAILGLTPQPFARCHDGSDALTLC